METVKIDIYISDLLYSYDCVIVPEFGGFVANYSAAKIQAIHHKFLPPSKRISFNKNLKSNDGLLTNHIAERRSISYGEAHQLIQLFVSQSIDGLKRGDKIYIEKVGTLFLDPEKNIQFNAEERNDYLLDSFGLTSFRALPIEREGSEERIRAQIEKTIPILKEDKQRKKVDWPAVATFALLLLSSILLNNKFKWVGEDYIQYSAFSWEDKQAEYTANEVVVKGFENSETNELILPTSPEIVAYITSEGESTALLVRNEETKIKVEADHTKVATSNLSKELKFHVMGGCFTQLSNAEKLVAELQEKGFEARLLGTYKNLHAVSFGSFSQREDAISLLDQVRNNDNPDAWLLAQPF